MKYKIGDRIETIKKYRDIYRKGERGVVIEIDANDEVEPILVEFDGDNSRWWMLEGDFKIVKPKSKTGDKYKIGRRYVVKHVADDQMYGSRVGDIVRIIDYDDSKHNKIHIKRIRDNWMGWCNEENLTRLANNVLDMSERLKDE